MADSVDPPVSSTSSRRPRGRTRCDATAAISGHIDTRTAAMEVADRLYDGLSGDCHVLLVFASFHHRAAFSEVVQHLRQTLTPGMLLGVTAESVLGVDEEREGRAGLSALALQLPDVHVHPWLITPDHPLDATDASALRERLGVRDDLRAVMMVADPFSVAMGRLLPAISGCGSSGQTIPVVGGMASGASQPGHNVLAIDDWTGAAGAVGLSLAGPLDVDFIVSQGCRPIGKPLVVTKANGNVILELGGQVPMAVLKQMALELDEHERQLLNRGLLVGVVIDEYKERFGRSDFLVRNVVSLDLKRGVIAVADQMRVGQTVQFHVRDHVTASEDLQLLLDAQQLAAPPFAATLFTCNGRGRRLFPNPNHDVEVLGHRLGQVPLAGFFAAGEIGPIGNRSFLHGHTASVAVFRERQADP